MALGVTALPLPSVSTLLDLTCKQQNTDTGAYSDLITTSLCLYVPASPKSISIPPAYGLNLSSPCGTQIVPASLITFYYNHLFAYSLIEIRPLLLRQSTTHKTRVY